MCNIVKVSATLWRGQDAVTGAVFYGSSYGELLQNWREATRG